MVKNVSLTTFTGYSHIVKHYGTAHNEMIRLVHFCNTPTADKIISKRIYRGQ